MTITSPVFQHNQQIPSKYTCDGENVNPPLELGDVPKDAQSLVLIVDDPDAVSGIWDHWVVFNMPPSTTLIKENSAPPGIEGTTSWGTQKYGGPCPPPASPEQLQRGESGNHRYFFKLYALDSLLNLDESATKTTIEQEMEGHILEKAELIGLYQRT